MNSNLEQIIFKKNFIWNILGTTFNAFNSLFFMIIVTRVNGINDAGIFTLAFSFACLVFTIGVFAGRTFQVTDNKNYSDKEYIVHRAISVILMLVISFVYVYIQGYSYEKVIVVLLLCLFKAQEAFCDTIYGIFQKNGCLYKAGFSMFIKSISSLLIFLIVDLITRNLVYSCISINIVWLIVFILYDLKNIREEPDLGEFILHKSLNLFKRGAFAFLFTFLTIYIVNLPKYTMDTLISNDIQAIFGIILMPATIISLCGQYLLNPFLNQMKVKYQENDKKGFNKIITKIICILIGLGILAIILMLIIGINIMIWVYNVCLSNYTIDIIIILIGGILYASTMILSTALTTLRKTFVQFVINAIVSIIGCVGSILLISNFGLKGAVQIYFMIMFIQFLLHYFLYRYYLASEFKNINEKY